MTQHSENTFENAILFDSAQKLDKDQEQWMKLRGHNDNLLIDASTPLIGMALRVRHIQNLDNVSALYKQAVEDVQAVKVELGAKNYGKKIISAHCYILCSFLDEAVMGTPWGAHSEWAKESLLTRFYNETWGGEKVFSILEMLKADPHYYQELLEFTYYCLVLGFYGRYKVKEGGHEEHEKVIRSLHTLLQRLKNEEPQKLTIDNSSILKRPIKLLKRIPLWGIVLFFGGILGGVFTAYSFVLNEKTIDVLEKLRLILH